MLRNLSILYTICHFDIFLLLLISAVVNPKDKINLISGIILKDNSRFQDHSSFGSSGYSFLTEQRSEYAFHTEAVCCY